MTVISVFITRDCVVHASDSFITEKISEHNYKVSETKRSKVIAIPHWRGAMSYWGLARYRSWLMVDWLQDQANKATGFESAEKFAYSVAAELNKVIRGMRFVNPMHAGIGIHLTVYEYKANYWIPELFLISNHTNTSYTAIHPEIHISRETYHTISDEDPHREHSDEAYRFKVHQHLQEGKWIFYNNGDPIMFNKAANTILSSINDLAQRGLLLDHIDVGICQAIARRPIEIISQIQADFCRKNAKLVGGKPHSLAITPGGEYFSQTGDCP
jgi:hypothetical protein